jgi:aspartate/methionine/tyrosine aminotransferase
MVPGPVQAAAAVALDDDEHVERQRERYAERLERCGAILAEHGVAVEQPGGGFYLWVEAPEHPLVGEGEPARTSGEVPEPADWRFARELAEHGGALGSPGEFYGPDGAGFVRLAMVQPLERIELVGERLAAAVSRSGAA